MAVEGRRDLLPQLLAQRHPGGRGQLPAIGTHRAAEDSAPRGIQGPAGAREEINLTALFTERHLKEGINCHNSQRLNGNLIEAVNC